MKRFGPLLAAIAAAAACTQEQAGPPAAAPAPAYAEMWFSGGDASSILNLHETQGGLAGRLIDTTGKIYPVRNILKSETALSFIVPALDAGFSASKTADSAWSGTWLEGEKAPEDLTLSSSAAPAQSSSPDGSSARFVTLPDGRQIFITCSGAGAPAVIFDAGAGGDSNSWRGVREEVGRTTLSCAYDRAGRGLSDPGLLPRDAGAVASDMDAMLAAAKIAGPYVLVGHSLGSYHVRQFANTRFEKMAGMVLVDPSGDGQAERFDKVLPKITAVSNATRDKAASLNCVGAMRAKLVPHSDPLVKDCLGNDADMIEGYLSEVAEMPGASTRELLASRRQWADMPLIVLTRGDYEKDMPADFTAEDRAAMKSVWLAMHKEMTALSSAGQIRTVDGAGHIIQRDKPQAVIDAVADVVAAARARPAAQ